MTINYIYDQQGTLEYAIVPADVWEAVKKYAPATELSTPIKAPEDEPFDPTEFYGMLSHLDLDIEQELLDMRKGWIKST